ncbi:MAG: signal peptidase I [Cellvibrionales bacterium TMED47]|nr:signal peptidase I [Porticoccaceae bacterium]RPG83945.1 MAG: signal peptidase I [Cellvibrionales bacterium TMED47]
MDFNFELILTVIFFICGLCWLMNKSIRADEDSLIGFFASLAPVLVFVLVLRSFIAEPFQIPSKSMVPTLKVGDYILVNKWIYGLRLPVLHNKIIDVSLPERGDVMVFYPPHQDRYFIKRVIGLPGDKVNLIKGQLFINGEKMAQKAYMDEPAAPSSVVMTEDLGSTEHLMQRRNLPTRLSLNFSTTVPAGHYFMMGDNRDNSSDSRVWGPVPENRIVGKAFARWMFWDSFTSLPSFERAGKIQ